MTDKTELLTATDETIDDAVNYADPMVLRCLVYLLTGDESIAVTQVTTVYQRFQAGQCLKGPRSGSIQADVSNASEVKTTQNLSQTGTI